MVQLKAKKGMKTAEKTDWMVVMKAEKKGSKVEKMVVMMVVCWAVMLATYNYHQ